jgi:hypothetical protein
LTARKPSEQNTALLSLLHAYIPQEPHGVPGTAASVSQPPHAFMGHPSRAEASTETSTKPSWLVSADPKASEVAGVSIAPSVEASRKPLFDSRAPSTAATPPSPKGGTADTSHASRLPQATMESANARPRIQKRVRVTFDVTVLHLIELGKELCGANLWRLTR